MLAGSTPVWLASGLVSRHKCTLQHEVDSLRRWWKHKCPDPWLTQCIWRIYILQATKELCLSPGLPSTHHSCIIWTSFSEYIYLYCYLKYKTSVGHVQICSRKNKRMVIGRFFAAGRLSFLSFSNWVSQIGFYLYNVHIYCFYTVPKIIWTSANKASMSQIEHLQQYIYTVVSVLVSCIQYISNTSALFVTTRF